MNDLVLILTWFRGKDKMKMEKLDNVIDEVNILHQTTAVLNLMQTALAEGNGLNDDKVIADALFFVCINQSKAIENLENYLNIMLIKGV